MTAFLSLSKMSSEFGGEDEAPNDDVGLGIFEVSIDVRGCASALITVIVARIASKMGELCSSSCAAFDALLSSCKAAIAAFNLVGSLVLRLEMNGPTKRLMEWSAPLCVFHGMTAGRFTG